jgi:hypothetical protein
VATRTVRKVGSNAAVMDPWGILAAAVAINWVAPLAQWLYPLYITLFTGDMEFVGFHGPWAKFSVRPTAKAWHYNLWRNWDGVGLYGFLCYKPNSRWTPEYTQQVVKHEAEHCKHWVIFGMSFYLLYTVHMAWIYAVQKLKGPPYTKHPYFDCWSERLARKAAGEKVDIPPMEWPCGTTDLWPWW